MPFGVRLMKLGVSVARVPKSENGVAISAMACEVSWLYGLLRSRVIVVSAGSCLSVAPVTVTVCAAGADASPQATPADSSRPSAKVLWARGR